MKYRVQIQQVFGGNWKNIEEASANAEWLQCDSAKPRGRIAGIRALADQVNKYKNGAPHRLVAIDAKGNIRVIETMSRGEPFFF